MADLDQTSSPTVDLRGRERQGPSDLRRLVEYEARNVVLLLADEGEITPDEAHRALDILGLA